MDIFLNTIITSSNEIIIEIIFVVSYILNHSLILLVDIIAREYMNLQRFR